VNHRWRIGARLAIGLLAISGSGFAIAADTGDVAPEIEAPSAPSKAKPAFSADEQRRLLELRAWLARRRMGRKLDQPGSLNAIRESSLGERYPRQLLNGPSRSWSGVRNGEIGRFVQRNPTLHIGRGPDGRIYHRYVFGDSGPDQVQSAAPGYAASPVRRNR